MKRILKSIFVVTLVVSMVLSGTLTSFGAETNGIKVQYNGENIQLTNAAKIVNGKTMLPFRQIFETMGAEVAYDATTKTVTATTPEKKVSFTVGKQDLTIEENGVITTQKMETAPFVDATLKSTFVPVRQIAEVLGYSVGWDATNKTVIIIDPDTIFANADEDFSVISKLMKTGLDMEKAYRTEGKFDMNLTTYADPNSIMPPFDCAVKGTVSGTQQKSNSDLAMNLAFNFDNMLKKLTAEEQAQFAPLLNTYKNVSMKIKTNGETGVTYMNSNMFTAIDPTMGENAWYKMNVYDSYESMGIDLKSIQSMSYSNLDISEAMAGAFSNMDNADTSTYQEMKTSYEFFKNLIGDTAFKKSSSGDYNTYNLSLDKATILAAMAKTALTEGVSTNDLDMAEIGDMLSSASFGGTIMIKEQSGNLCQYALKGNYSQDGTACTFDMSGDPKNAKGNIAIDSKDAFKVNVNIESHIYETTQAPDLNLPAGAKVVDYPVPSMK